MALQFFVQIELADRLYSWVQLLAYWIMAVAQWVAQAVAVTVLSCLLAGCSNQGSERWAVLVASSPGWEGGYYGQASVCAAYHMLLDRGFAEANIITIMPDDAANSSQNPYQGQLFNRLPNSTGNISDADVHGGCKIDYRGDQVNVLTFLRVLNETQSSADLPKVLTSGPQDYVFVYLVGEGHVSSVKFPGQSLHADNVTAVLKLMKKNGKFGELVFYLDSNHSGSMFDGLSEDMPVYAMTSTDSSGSAPKADCGIVLKNHTMPCMGTKFSHSWMNDTEKHGGTFQEQFDNVKAQVGNSTSVFGRAKDFFSKSVADFLGKATGGDLKLERLYRQYLRTNSNSDARAITQEIEARQAVESQVVPGGTVTVTV